MPSGASGTESDARTRQWGPARGLIVAQHRRSPRLLFLVRPHIDVAPARAALVAHDLASERRSLNVIGMARHGDQRLTAAGVVVAARDQSAHA